MLDKLLLICAVCAVLWHLAGLHSQVQAANPYLPLWEHVPDAEPRVFEDPDNPGRYRLYVYGSHDTRRTAYCGYDIIVWSAPVDDLTDWRCDGVVFQSIVNGAADVLFAPDCVEVVEPDGTKSYYLYPNNQGGGRNTMVAKAKRPDGPFEVINWRPGSTTQTQGVMGFDPAVLVDDDGRVYGYYGFQRITGVELDPATMARMRPDTAPVVDMIGSCTFNDGNVFRYFEAPSVRKIEGKYVLVYSRKTVQGEYGLGESVATLAYAYADSPLGPWTYGGTIIDARAPEVGPTGRMIATQPGHNTHGGLVEVGGQWFITYHRAINNDGYSRQATAEPVEVRVTETGELIITGTRQIVDDYGNVYTGAEVTSQGFEINGLNPYKYCSAGITCYLLGGPYVKATYDTWRDDAPVVNIRSYAIVGFKYFNFSAAPQDGKSTELEVYITPKGAEGKIEVWLGSPWEERGGSLLGGVSFPAGLEERLTKLVIPVPEADRLEGKQAVYFVFRSDSREQICEFNGFKFNRVEAPAAQPSIAELDEWDRANLIPPNLTIYAGGRPLEAFQLSDYDYNVYKHTLVVPAGTEDVPQVTAEADDPRVEIEIEQAQSLPGTAVVKFRKLDPKEDYPAKLYYIEFKK
ncbi:MAG: family 43 glycosylhydrolase [Limnochordia bacterium]|jgi:arabinoxylan arabinofuranohydrolase|nr:family 43 glycosylhydrolase [Bacillota bacterium]NLH32086.1 family 43 glycosylhydrolase [Bacillota bacterium]HOB08384.1 family 43 glycosylhydrolase [Limnochordia bacterium]HPZ30592.1 family 43 glycosylhydrolase [Limnochordia bacterium]HQD70247.1 family 43 glycosylhydrolase [Limnochordia bacterium]